MRPFFIIFGITIAAIIVLLLSGVALTHSTGAIGGVSEFMNTARVWLYSVQLGFIGAVWWQWATFVKWMVRRGKLSEERAMQLQAARNRIMAMVLFFQVVVVMGIPFRNPFAG